MNKTKGIQTNGKFHPLGGNPEAAEGHALDHDQLALKLLPVDLW